MVKDTIKSSIEAALDEDPNSFAEKINDVLAAKSIQPQENNELIVFCKFTKTLFK